MRLNPELERALGGLRNAIAAESVKEMEEWLAIIIRMRDKESIEPLLKLLRDDFEYEEGMWTVMQTAENFDAETYVKALLKSIGDIFRDAPIWADTLLARVLNGKAHLSALHKEFQRSTNDEKLALALALNHLRRKSPGRFDQRIDAVMRG